MTPPGPLRRGVDAVAPAIRITSCAGGEGASTVADLLRRSMTVAPALLARADDPAPPGSAAAVDGLIIDAGPCAPDGAGAVSALTVLVASTTPAAIARAVAVLDAPGRVVTALVLTARSPGEDRGGRVRARETARRHPSVVVLPYDAHLRRDADPGGRSAATQDAAARLLLLLANPFTAG